MDALHAQTPQSTLRNRSTLSEIQYERWMHCHVNWTSVWVGALASFAMVALFGLIGTAIGAHQAAPDARLVDLKKLGIEALIFSICAAFFSMVVGGWVAGKIAGILHSEPAMLHGAIVWLLTLPLLITAVSLGAGSVFGAWYGGLSASTAVRAPYERPEQVGVNATPEQTAAYRSQMAEYRRNMDQWNEDTPRVTRNTALVAITALLLGLIGSVVGGWIASGEPMNFVHHTTRKPLYHVSN